MTVQHKPYGGLVSIFLWDCVRDQDSRPAYGFAFARDRPFQKADINTEPSTLNRESSFGQ